MFSRPRPAVKARGIHLDLKGLPPTPKRLLEIPDLLGEARINCLLVEWEDTYPWTCHPELRSETAYSERTVRRFLDRAEELGIEVVPLVQCFGHLENLLSRERFRHLRERPDVVGDICPSKPGAAPLIAEMIDDILRTHGGRIRRFHLGGDEVWSLGSCRKCAKAVKEEGKPELYMRHVEPFLDRLGAEGITPILWDDMMREWPPKLLRRLAPKAELMCWSYAAEPFKWLKAECLERYAAAGIGMWGGAAFKGADGAQADVCDLGTRAANVHAWTKAARRHGLAGVVAAGWSRYTTFMAPCEGLEASLHSLVMAGAIMWDGAIPEDTEAEAVEFLNSGGRKRLAGERFVRCLAASREFSDWGTYLQRLVERARSFPHAAGEAGRFDPRHRRDFHRGWRKHLDRGERIAREWKKAHAGLVPRVWLEGYARSRTWLPRAVHDSLHKGLERRLPGTGDMQ